jgi:hypothetical protein
MINFLRNIYYCVLPGFTLVYAYLINRRIKSTYETLVSTLELHNDAYTILSKWQFSVSDKHNDIRAVIPRGKVSADNIDYETVIVDAKIHMYEVLEPVLHVINQYNMIDDVYIDIDYLAEQDVVAVYIRPSEHISYNSALEFIPVNLVCTALWLVIFVLLTIIYNLL